MITEHLRRARAHARSLTTELHEIHASLRRVQNVQPSSQPATYTAAEAAGLVTRAREIEHLLESAGGASPPIPSTIVIEDLDRYAEELETIDAALAHNEASQLRPARAGGDARDRGQGHHPGVGGQRPVRDQGRAQGPRLPLDARVENGIERAWWTEVLPENLDAELDWLRTTVYRAGGLPHIPQRRITACDRWRADPSDVAARAPMMPATPGPVAT